MPLKDPDAYRKYQREYQKRRRIEDPEWAEKQRTAFRRRSQERYANDSEYRAMKKRHGRLSRYKITEDQYQQLLIEQEHLCAVCKIVKHSNKKHKRLHVDHCHKTGKVRGLLCMKCNVLILNNSSTPLILRRSANYLESSCRV